MFDSFFRLHYGFFSVFCIIDSCKHLLHKKQCNGIISCISIQLSFLLAEKENLFMMIFLKLIYLFKLPVFSTWITLEEDCFLLWGLWYFWFSYYSYWAHASKLKYCNLLICRVGLFKLLSQREVASVCRIFLCYILFACFGVLKLTQEQLYHRHTFLPAPLFFVLNS